MTEAEARDHRFLRASLSPAAPAPLPAVGEGDVFRGMVGRSPAMRALFGRVAELAPSPAPALVAGPPGSGKRLVARALHDLSGRQGPFVAVRPGGGLGAAPARARGGTLFLDGADGEEGVLRGLLGGPPPDGGGFRLVASVRGGGPGAPGARVLLVPALAERDGDVPLLLSFFLARRGEGAPLLGRDALALLEAHPWPGNVRELEGLAGSLAGAGGGAVVGAGDLPAGYRGRRPAVELPEGGMDLRAELAAIEGSLIDQALERSGGNKNRAAGLLGLGRTTFIEKLRRRGAGRRPPGRRGPGSGPRTGTGRPGPS